MSDGTIEPSYDRSDLVDWLTSLDNHMRWVDKLYARKAEVEAAYVQPLPHKARWGLSDWRRLVGLLVLSFFVMGLGMSLGSALVLLVLTGVVGAAVMIVPVLQGRQPVSFNFRLGKLRWLAYLLGAVMVLSALMHPAGALFLLIIGAIYLAIVLAVRNFVLVPWLSKVLARKNEQIDQHNARVRQEAAPLDAQLAQAGQEMVEAGVWEIYPEPYLYPEAVAFVITAVRNHRADTIGQAINLYEQTLHQQRLEANQQQMIAEQKRQQQLQVMSAVINTAMQSATISAIHEEGAATRAATAANTQSINEQLRKPVRIHKSSW